MAWIEAHQELRDHPKIKRAARVLGISRPQMIGHMLCLWWWCLDYAQDGDLSDFDNADIADAAAWEGEPDTFINALVNCGPADRPGLLVRTNDGVTVNDWAEYGGKYITKRNQGRDRQRTYRQRNAEVTRYKDVSNSVDKIIEDKSRVDEIITANDDFREKLIRQWEGVMGMFPTASYPDAIVYMDKLQEAKALDWWGLALTETVDKAKRPSWQYMKAILEGWLAAGKPSTAKTNGATRVPAPPKEQQQLEDARQAEYERQMAEQLARAGRMLA